MTAEMTGKIIDEIEKQPEEKKKELFWDFFVTSGKIDAYLMLKKYQDKI